MTPGQRQNALEALAIKIEMLAHSYRHYQVGLDVYARRCSHPAFVEACKVLSERLAILDDFDFPRAAFLLDCDPADFTDVDMNLAVRAIWKSDRVGFYLGGDELFRNGYIAKLIRHWDSPRSIEEASPTPREYIEFPGHCAKNLERTDS